MLPIRKKNDYMQSWLDDFFSVAPYSKDEGGLRKSIPAINVLEEKDAFVIEVAAPGLERSDLKVSVDENILTIYSEKSGESEDKKKNYLRREFYYSNFKRSFSLPEGVDVDGVSARSEHGVLQIIIPKKSKQEEKKQRMIDIA